jgi:hypothetical protein
MPDEAKLTTRKVTRNAMSARAKSRGTRGEAVCVRPAGSTRAERAVETEVRVGRN